MTTSTEDHFTFKTHEIISRELFSWFLFYLSEHSQLHATGLMTFCKNLCPSIAEIERYPSLSGDVFNSDHT